MNTPDTQTETIERTETVTETVTKAECPVCEQRVDAAEFVPVAVGVDVEQTATCLYCAESLFGYEGEAAGLDGDADATSDTSPDNSHRKHLAPLAVGLIVSVVVEAGVLSILPVVVILFTVWLVLKMMIAGPRP